MPPETEEGEDVETQVDISHLSMSNTKDEIIEGLIDRGISFNKNDTKKELLEKLGD